MSSNYENKLFKDYEKLQIKYDKKCLENKHVLLRAIIAEDEERRLARIISKQESEIDILEKQNKELKYQIEQAQKEIERLKTIQNNDGTVCGLPTSMTPIGKKKVIPNFAKNTGEKIGRKEGHKKDKLERIDDNILAAS